MTTLSERIDHFVRWFVNSSPQVTHIARRPKPVDRPGAADEKRLKSRPNHPRKPSRDAVARHLTDRCAKFRVRPGVVVGKRSSGRFASRVDA